LSVSMSTVIRLIVDGELKGLKVGGQWRIHPEDLAKYTGRPLCSAPPPQPQVSNRATSPIPARKYGSNPLLGPDGQPVLGPDGMSVLGLDGEPLRDSKGRVLRPVVGSDGKPQVRPDGAVAYFDNDPF
jgi:excisionase family DNA binding protein